MSSIAKGLEATVSILRTLTLTTNVIVAFILVMVTLIAKSSEHRGTNTVTRFVRSTTSHATYRIVLVISLLATALCSLVALHCGIPTALVSIFCLYLIIRNNKNKNRISDTRKITGATAAIAEPVVDAVTPIAVGAAVASGAGAPAVVATGVAGAVAEEVLDYASDEIAKTEGDDIKQLKDNVRSNLSFRFTNEEFIASARRAGLSTEGRSNEEIAESVLDVAPISLLDELPDDTDVVSKAMYVLKGSDVQWEEQQG